MFRVTYKGVSYVFRLIEEITKGANRVSMAANANNARLASVMAAMNQQDYSTRSAIEMERMLQQGKGFCQFDIMEKDYQTFMDAAKEAGVRYSCVTMDKIHQPGERLFTIFCSPNQADIVNRIIEINELNVVHSMDYAQESAREVTPQEVRTMTEEELRRHNQARNADFFAQFIDDIQPKAPVNPTMRAEQIDVTPSEPPSVSTASGRQSVRARVQAIRLGAGKEAIGLPAIAGSTPSRDDAARAFYEKNLKNLSITTREI